MVLKKIEYQYFSGYCIKVKIYCIISIANTNLHICSHLHISLKQPIYTFLGTHLAVSCPFFLFFHHWQPKAKNWVPISLNGCQWQPGNCYCRALHVDSGGKHTAMFSVKWCLLIKGTQTHMYTLAHIHT